MRIKLPELQDETQWHGKFLWWPRVIGRELVWLESVWHRRTFHLPSCCFYNEYALQVPKEI